MLNYALTRLAVNSLEVESFSVLVFKLDREKGANPYGQSICRTVRGNSSGADFVSHEVGHAIDVVGHDSLDRSCGPLSCGS